MNQWDTASETYADVLAQRYVLRDAIKGIFPNQPPLSVLDLGCGIGEDTKYFYERGSNVVGVDSSKESIRIARENYPGIRYLEDDLREISLGETFETVIANMVIPNMSDDRSLRALMGTAKKHLSKRGTLWATNVHPNFQRTSRTVFFTHKYPDTVQEGAQFEVDIHTTASLSKAAIAELEGLTNYHWSQDMVEAVARSVGFQNFKTIPLLSYGLERDEDRKNPKYVMFKIN